MHNSGYTNGSNWGETYTIDAWGNLTNRGPVSGKNNYEPLSTSALANNQLTGFGYDAAGNMTSNASATYTYDAENRLTTAAGVTYTYDGDGNRVEKSDGTLYWGAADTGSLAETNLSGALLEEYIYFNGQRVARREPSGDVRYYFSDHLHTADVIAYTTGSIKEESDYYPYGGEIPVSGSDTNHYKFDAKERDVESGLDNFAARYDSSALGRFMSPDDLGGHPEDPQSLNKYTYTRNNPTNLIDPTGMTFEESCKKESNTCRDNGHGQLVKFEISEDKFGQVQFAPAHIDSDQGGNLTDQNGNKFSANVTGAGVSFTQAGSSESSTGLFVNGSGSTTIQGSGALSGFSFNFTYSNPASGVTAGGTFTFNGTAEQAENTLQGAGFNHYWEDESDFLHPSTYHYAAVDFRSAGDAGTGALSGHFTVHEPRVIVHGAVIPQTYVVPTEGTLHLGEHNPYQSWDAFKSHTEEVLRYLGF